MNKPKISVIIPIYNVEKYLDRCLGSVSKQSFKDIEIICVDDCSPDNSRQIVEKHAAKDSRIQIIRHTKNLGLGGARNTALRVAKADYIASVDSDDYMLPEMLESLWEAAEDGVFDIVCCGFNRVDELGNIISYETYTDQIISNKDNSINIFSTMNPAFWNKLWRKSLFTENDIFFPMGDYFEDMPTTPRILSKAKKIRIISDRLYHYFVRTESISNTFSSKHMIDYFKGFEIILNFLEENGLVERYNDEFMAYVNWSIRYHSETVIGSEMNKEELKQYFRQFLMLKIAFFENRDLFKTKNIGELLDLLKQPQIQTALLKHKKAIGILEVDNTEVLARNLECQNDVINKEQENYELVRELLENKNLYVTLKQKKSVMEEKILKFQSLLEMYERETSDKEKIILKSQDLLDISEQKIKDLALDLSNNSSNIEVLEKEVIDYKNSFEDLESDLMRFSSNLTKYEDKILILEQEKNENVSCTQTFGILLFGIFFRPFFSRKQYLKLRRRPRLFFKDSKNKFSRSVGALLKII